MPSIKTARLRLVVCGIFTVICGTFLVICGILQLKFHSYKAQTGHGVWSGVLLGIHGFLAIGMAKRKPRRSNDLEKREYTLIVMFISMFSYVALGMPSALVLCSNSASKDQIATREHNPDWCFNGCCTENDCPKSPNQTDTHWTKMENETDKKSMIPCWSRYWERNCRPNNSALAVIITEVILLVIGFILLVTTACNVADLEQELSKTEPEDMSRIQSTGTMLGGPFVFNNESDLDNMNATAQEINSCRSASSHRSAAPALNNDQRPSLPALNNGPRPSFVALPVGLFGEEPLEHASSPVPPKYIVEENNQSEQPKEEKENPDKIEENFPHSFEKKSVSFLKDTEGVKKEELETDIPKETENIDQSKKDNEKTEQNEGLNSENEETTTNFAFHDLNL